MPLIKSEEAEREAVLDAVRLMLVSARTAPKTREADDILTLIISGKEKEALAAEMDRIAEERRIERFKRDAQNLRDSEAAILVGVRGTTVSETNCGACGYASCSEFLKAEKKTGRDFVGPNCVFKVLDLGIALGSAAKTASILNIDNRIMYRVGAAARRLNLLPEATVIMGIPVSARGKNIYFDRKL